MTAARRLANSGWNCDRCRRNVHLELHDVDANPQLAARYGIGPTPAIALLTGGVVIEDTHIRFQGLPEGTVLEALVNGMVAVSQGDALLTEAALTEAARRRAVQWPDAVEAATWREPERLDWERLDWEFLVGKQAAPVAAVSTQR